MPARPLQDFIQAQALTMAGYHRRGQRRRAPPFYARTTAT